MYGCLDLYNLEEYLGPFEQKSGLRHMRRTMVVVWSFSLSEMDQSISDICHSLRMYICLELHMLETDLMKVIGFLLMSRMVLSIHKNKFVYL